MPSAATRWTHRLAHSAKDYKSEEERQIPRDIVYKWNLKYNTTVLIHKRETDTQTHRIDLWVPRGRGAGEGQTGSLGLGDASPYT